MKTFFYLISFLLLNSSYPQSVGFNKIPYPSSPNISESCSIILSDNTYCVYFLKHSFIINGIQINYVDSVFASKSTDRGRTWANPTFIFKIDSADRNYSSDLAVIKLKSGKLIMFWSTIGRGIFYRYSENEGESWSEEIKITTLYYINRDELFNLNVIQISNGDIWLTMREKDGSAGYYMVSTDDLATWEEMKIFHQNSSYNYGIELVEDSSNQLLAFMRTSIYPQGSGIYLKKSTDYGNTWSNPELIFSSEYLDIYSSFEALQTADGKLRIYYDKMTDQSTSNDTIRNLNIYYVEKEEDWTEPVQITKYIGKDYKVDISPHYKGKMLITFLSERYKAATRVTYSVMVAHISVMSDFFTPPLIMDVDIDTEQDLQNNYIVKTKVTSVDETGISSVKFYFDVKEEIELFDDGLHNDEEANDNIYGNIHFYVPSFKGSKNIAGSNKIIMPLNGKGTLADSFGELLNFDSLVVYDVENFSAVIKDISSGAGIISGRYEESSFLFSGGFFLTGYTNNQLWGSGQATASLVENFLAGPVNQPVEDPNSVIYKVRSDDQPFSESWQLWREAVELGAEFYDGDKDTLYNPVDKNLNGIWDPDEDMPDLIGDETIWCVFNDGQPVSQRLRFHGVEPQGIEIEQTLFASSNPELENTLFIKYKIKNSGLISPILDSVYLSLWTDPDIGDHENDIIGCDTLLNSVFAYNTEFDEEYGANPPAFFTTLLQGSAVNGNQTDTALINNGQLLGSRILPGKKNLNLTSFTKYLYSNLNSEQGLRDYQLANSKTGEILSPCNDPHGEVFGVNCEDVNPFFWYSGDPVENTGWIMTTATDQVMLPSSGPFTLTEDEPVEIIYAYIMGRGTDNLNSITVGRQNVQRAIDEYNSNFKTMVSDPGEPLFVIDDYELFQNYPNPFNPATTIRYDLPEDGIVKLEIFNILGEKVRTLVNQFQNKRRYEIDFDATGLASGVYIYRLQVNDFVDSKKMILLR